jgi:hypothetical protein
MENVRQTITLYRTGEMMSMPPGLHKSLRSIMQDRWSEKHHLVGKTE